MTDRQTDRHTQCVADVCRSAKVLENRITADEERIKLLEKELEMAIVFGEEADRKYEEVSTKCYSELL